MSAQDFKRLAERWGQNDEVLDVQRVARNAAKVCQIKKGCRLCRREILKRCGDWSAIRRGPESWMSKGSPELCQCLPKSAKSKRDAGCVGARFQEVGRAMGRTMKSWMSKGSPETLPKSAKVCQIKKGKAGCVGARFQKRCGCQKLCQSLPIETWGPGAGTGKATLRSSQRVCQSLPNEMGGDRGRVRTPASNFFGPIHQSTAPNPKFVNFG